MPPTVRLTVVTGPHKDKRFCFRGQAHCLLGRGPDSAVQLAGERRDQLISRHHCALDIDGPCVHIEDLKSSNGTFLNGAAVAALEQSVADALAQVSDPRVSVKSGDIVTVGGTSLRIDIVDCPPPGIASESVWQPGEIEKRDCPADC